MGKGRQFWTVRGESKHVNAAGSNWFYNITTTKLLTHHLTRICTEAHSAALQTAAR